MQLQQQSTARVFETYGVLRLKKRCRRSALGASQKPPGMGLSAAELLKIQGCRPGGAPRRDTQRVSLGARGEIAVEIRSIPSATTKRSDELRYFFTREPGRSASGVRLRVLRSTQQNASVSRNGKMAMTLNV